MFESFWGELSKEPVWTIIGLAGQAAFGGRFIIQWIASEMKKKSHVPISFWYLSLIGSLILLVYCVHRREPILILGFIANSFVYLRNLDLIFRGSKAKPI